MTAQVIQFPRRHDPRRVPFAQVILTFWLCVRLTVVMVGMLFSAAFAR